MRRIRGMTVNVLRALLPPLGRGDRLVFNASTEFGPMFSNSHWLLSGAFFGNVLSEMTKIAGAAGHQGSWEYRGKVCSTEIDLSTFIPSTGGYQRALSEFIVDGDRALMIFGKGTRFDRSTMELADEEIECEKIFALVDLPYLLAIRKLGYDFAARREYESAEFVSPFGRTTLSLDKLLIERGGIVRGILMPVRP